MKEKRNFMFEFKYYTGSLKLIQEKPPLIVRYKN